LHKFHRDTSQFSIQRLVDHLRSLTPLVNQEGGSLSAFKEEAPISISQRFVLGDHHT